MFIMAEKTMTLGRDFIQGKVINRQYRMFQIINSFIAGELTDEQCKLFQKPPVLALLKPVVFSEYKKPAKISPPQAYIQHRSMLD